VRIRPAVLIVADASQGPNGDWTHQESRPDGVDLARSRNRRCGRLGCALRPRTPWAAWSRMADSVIRLSLRPENRPT